MIDFISVYLFIFISVLLSIGVEKRKTSDIRNNVARLVYGPKKTGWTGECKIRSK